MRGRKGRGFCPAERGVYYLKRTRSPWMTSFPPYLFRNLFTDAKVPEDRIQHVLNVNKASYFANSLCSVTQLLGTHHNFLLSCKSMELGTDEGCKKNGDLRVSRNASRKRRADSR